MTAEMASTNKRARWVSEHEDRGQNNLVAIVLLVAIVAIGAFAVFAVSGVMIDGLQGELGTDQLESTMGVIDQDISTVASAGGVRDLPEGGYDDMDVSEDGTVAVAWHETPPAEIDADALEFTEENSSSLGEIQLHSGDTTVVHQGGGVFAVDNDDVRVHRSPQIGFDANETLQLSFTQIRPSEDGSNGYSQIAANQSHAEETSTSLEQVSTDPTADHLYVKIESEYAEGWERHLSEEVGGVENASIVAHSEDDEYVILGVEQLGDVDNSAHFLIEHDQGLVDNSGNSLEYTEGTGDHIVPNITIQNHGGESAEVTANVTIYNETGAVGHLELDSNDTVESGETIQTPAMSADGPDKFIVNPGQGHPQHIELTAGQEYQYDIETEPGNDSFDQRGSFLHLKDETHFDVAETLAESDEDTDDIEITAAIRNVGVEGDRNVSLEISPIDSEQSIETTEADVSLEVGEEGTLTWTINESNWPNNAYEYVVRTEDGEAAGGQFEVTEGGAFVIDGDEGIPEDDLVEGTEGQVVPGDEPVTIRPNVTNTYDETETQTVSVRVIDEGGANVTDAETTVELEANESTGLEIPIDDEKLESGDLYQYVVETDDDVLDTPGSFLVLEEIDTLEIESATATESVKPGGSLDVDVAFADDEFEGDDEAVVWLEGFDGNIVAVAEVDPAEVAGDTISIEWLDVADPDDLEETDVTARTQGDSESVDVTVDSRLEVTDVTVLEESVEQGETATVEADLESLGGDSEHEVVLSGPDGEVATSTDASVAHGETETVTLEYSVPQDGQTDRVSVSTESTDTSLDDVVVVDRDGPICGDVDYEGSGDEHDPYQIENVDQLQCINDHDLDASYELVDDIDAHGTEFWNGGAGFDPIGSTGNQYTIMGADDDDSNWETFSGDFDGAGFEIDGLYIERPEEEFVGLFGATNYPRDSENTPWRVPARQYDPGEGSTIKNVRLSDVYVHGERHVGGLVGQAGGTIKDSRSEGKVKAEYQLVGGLVGDGAHADLDNELVAEGVVIGGDYRTPTEVQVGGDYYWNRGIGGLIGRSTWQTDVSTGYTDVEVRGPSMIGGIVGSSSNVESDFTQMYTVADLKIESEPGQTERPEYQGAIAGTIENQNDAFRESVYHDQSPPHASQTYGEEYHTPGGWTGEAIARDTEQMQGLDVTESGNMDGLDFQYDHEDNPWVAIPDDYPRFAWELEAEGSFEVEITDVDEEQTAGEFVEVDVTVTSLYQDSQEGFEVQNIALADSDGQTVDTEAVELQSSLDEPKTADITLIWRTTSEDEGVNELQVTSEDDTDAMSTEIEPADHGLGDSVPPVIGDAFEDSKNETDGDVGAPGDSDSSADDVPTEEPEIEIDTDGVDVG